MTSRGRRSDDAQDNAVGYRQPPRRARFMKGQRRNPAGRPRGRHREASYETVLGQMVTIREGGTERRVTAAEAFLLQLAKRGVGGDSAAARASWALIEDEAKKRRSQDGPLNIVWTAVAPAESGGPISGANTRKF